MQEQGTLCAYCTFGIHILLQHMLILQWSGTCTSDRGRYCVYAQEHCASSHHIHVPFGWGGSRMFTQGYSYRNCKVVTRLWEGCGKDVTRLWEGCYKITNMHLELISHVWLHCKTYCIVGIFHRGCNLHIFSWSSGIHKNQHVKFVTCIHVFVQTVVSLKSVTSSFDSVFCKESKFPWINYHRYITVDKLYLSVYLNPELEQETLKFELIFCLWLRLNLRTWACCVSSWPLRFSSTVAFTPRRHSGELHSHSHGLWYQCSSVDYNHQYWWRHGNTTIGTRNCITCKNFLSRGPANDWFEALHPYLLYSSRIRRWFVDTVFVQHRERFCEYLLESPSAEVKFCCMTLHALPVATILYEFKNIKLP